MTRPPIITYHFLLVTKIPGLRMSKLKTGRNALHKYCLNILMKISHYKNFLFPILPLLFYDVAENKRY